MKTSEVLRAAKALPWAAKDFAKNKDGEGVSPLSPDATCFCAYGAVARVLGIANIGEIPISEDPEAMRFLRDALPAGAWGSITIFSDHKPEAERLAWWDRAIELAEKAEAAP